MEYGVLNSLFPENTFASGSIDGTIILWKTDNLLPFRYFNSIPDYQGPNKTFPYSVQYMTCVESVSCFVQYKANR